MNSPQNQPPGNRLFRAIGPGLVTACVVIGPGSILTSSTVGADDGYSKVWVVILSVLAMLTYVTLGMRLGVATGQSNGELTKRYIHRSVAVVIGWCVFLISAAFQFGNNLGAHSAISAYVAWDYWPVVLNAIVLSVLFGFRNLYAFVERAMTFFVALMLVAFAANLVFAKPDPVEFAVGLVPLGGDSEIGLPLLGLIGTTFVIAAAYYQSYLVRFKGWTMDDYKRGMFDARVSAAIMGLITIMIMSTAAAVLRGQELSGVGDVANQLKPMFGEKGRAIFCLGLFAAAFSSFIVNSMIGG
ncbi:MAG: Nramp family divalent metal transporter, partial [Planctomycetales bacterium]|nr:Nramp family divalent metal transporter [Planctomycetales bacterium]